MIYTLMLPLLVTFLISGLLGTYFLNKYLEEERGSNALNTARDIESEVLLIESDVERYRRDFGYVTASKSDNLLTIATNDITYHNFFTDVSIQEVITGGTHKILSYTINRDITLAYFMELKDYKVTIKRSDGEKIISEPLINNRGISYTYYSEQLEWNIIIHTERSYSMLLFIVGFFLVFMITLLVSITIFISNINETIKSPLGMLLDVTREIGGGNYTFNLPSIELTEFYHIAESFSIMAEQVKSREKELHNYRAELERMVDERTIELQDTVIRLEETQEKLVESERMASLGLLVSGISHEINTPLGIVLTGMSYMEQELKRLQEAVESKTLTASGLHAFIQSSMENVTLSSRNSQKVSSLIKNFKMVAKDQESDDIRNFLIGEYIELIIANISGQYSYRGVDIEFNYSEDFYVTIYPGALYKVMHNLLLNSFQYGYNESDKGIISITMVLSGDEVQIIYKDDGAGMTREVLEKVFEPFYTTNRVAGNTGLGMFIVYNQVTQTLKGNITSLSRELNGTEYHLSFPVHLDK